MRKEEPPLLLVLVSAVCWDALSSGMLDKGFPSEPGDPGRLLIQSQWLLAPRGAWDAAGLAGSEADSAYSECSVVIE